MRIREEGAARLVIEDRPLFTGLLLSAMMLLDAAAVTALAFMGEWLGALMLFLGLGLLGVGFAVFVRRTIVFLDRASRTVLIRTSSVFGVTEESRPLADLRGAVVQTNRSGSGPATHRPALLFAEGARPLVLVYTSGRGADRVVAAVERWMTRP